MIQVLGTSLLRRHQPQRLLSSAIRSLSSAPHEEPQLHCSHSLLILGKPGGGKGTISGKILNDFSQFRHVSTGDELRQHVRNGTELGKEAKKYMDGEFICFSCNFHLLRDSSSFILNKYTTLLFPRHMQKRGHSSRTAS